MRYLSEGNPIASSAVRLIAGLFSGTISILLLMLVLGILSVQDLGNLLHLSEQQIEIINSVIVKIRVIVNDFLEILSKMLERLLSWTGADVDLSKIKIDLGIEEAPPADANAPKPSIPLPPSNPDVVEIN